MFYALSFKLRVGKHDVIHSRDATIVREVFDYCITLVLTQLSAWLQSQIRGP